MALKKDALKAGLKAGMAKEKAKADRFAVADQASEAFPQGIIKSSSDRTFSAESSGVSDRRQVIRIPLESLSDNPLNARRIYDPKVVQERAASLAKDGQKTPVLVAADVTRAGRFILIDGHYRKRGAQTLGWRTLECLVEEVKDEFDFYRLSFLMNEERESQTALDNALAWADLLDKKKIETKAQLGEILNISEANVNKTFALLSLPQNVLDLMREHPKAIGLATGYSLVLYGRTSTPESVLALAERVINENLSSRDVDELRKTLTTGKPRKTKEVSRQYKIKAVTGMPVAGVIKDWDSGRVLLDIKITDPKKREKVVEELKQQFGIGSASQEVEQMSAHSPS